MKKTNKKFIVILTAIALLVTGGVIISNWDAEMSPTETVQIVEPVIGRIDVSAACIEKSCFTVSETNGKELKEADWMKDMGLRGYTSQIDGSSTQFNIKSSSDCEIQISLRGKWEKDPEGNLLEHWVDFVSLTINDVEILSQKQTVWTNKPFRYVINAKAGETYNVVAKWQKHEESAE